MKPRWVNRLTILNTVAAFMGLDSPAFSATACMRSAVELLPRSDTRVRIATSLGNSLSPDPRLTGQMVAILCRTWQPDLRDFDNNSAKCSDSNTVQCGENSGISTVLAHKMPQHRPRSSSNIFQYSVWPGPIFGRAAAYASGPTWVQPNLPLIHRLPRVTSLSSGEVALNGTPSWLWISTVHPTPQYPQMVVSTR